LNKILETERKIKEYKEHLTKLQRDLYSKKESTGHINTPAMKKHTQSIVDKHRNRSDRSSSVKGGRSPALPKKKFIEDEKT
jgi:hypothetical protein